MTRLHSHDFVEEYDGFVGFGLDRETDEYTLTYYLQKFCDDELIALVSKRMSREEMAQLFNMLAGLLERHLAEEEYHKYFLKG